MGAGQEVAGAVAEGALASAVGRKSTSGWSCTRSERRPDGAVTSAE